MPAKKTTEPKTPPNGLTPDNVDADKLYTCGLLRPIRVGRTMVRPHHSSIVLKGRVITENADNVEPGTIAEHAG